MSRNPPKDTISLLAPSLSLLQLLHSRNKNQHRSTPWSRWLSILKRHLAHLITELSLSLSSESKRAQIRLLARETFLREHVLRKCYLAFRLLATEGRFCALGLVLLGVLARVKKVLGGKGKDAGEVVAGEMIGMEGDEDRHGVGDGEGLDLGERMERNDVDHVLLELSSDRLAGGSLALSGGDLKPAATVDTVLPPTESGNQVKGVIKDTKRKKKSKKPKNAIDDLFSNIT